jgi:hypothetical protein
VLNLSNPVIADSIAEAQLAYSERLLGMFDRRQAAAEQFFTIGISMDLPW